MNHTYTTKTGSIVLALTILCVFAWDLHGGSSIPSAAFFAFLVGLIPITWLPAFMARYEGKARAAAQELAKGTKAGP